MTRDDWMESQIADPPFGEVLAQPPEAAMRYHTTSGTSGSRPLAVLDGPKDWEWIAEMWCYALWGFGIRPGDSVFFAFSYGTFVGFWGAHYAAEKLGCLVLPGGNMTTEARVRQIMATDTTVVCSTPTYALRMAQEAQSLGIDLANGPVQRVLLSGEPAGSIPATKQLIEEQWGAKAADTAGMTEVGTIIMFECDHQPGGAHIIEDHFLEEVARPRDRRAGRLRRGGRAHRHLLRAWLRAGPALPDARSRRAACPRPPAAAGGPSTSTTAASAGASTT